LQYLHGLMLACDTIFASKDLDATNVAAFTVAADDARTVINYIHEYSVPVLPAAN
jgi:hypothetical protein